jgi:hypothetical protein
MSSFSATFTIQAEFSTELVEAFAVLFAGALAKLGSGGVQSAIAPMPPQTLAPLQQPDLKLPGKTTAEFEAERKTAEAGDVERDEFGFPTEKEAAPPKRGRGKASKAAKTADAVNSPPKATVTADELSAMAKKIVAKGGKYAANKFGDLLKGFRVQKLSELSEEQRAAMHTELLKLDLDDEIPY